MIFTDRAIERRRARQNTLLAYDGDLQSEDLEEAADALGVGTVLVLSDRTELVTAAVSRLGHIVGRSNIYALRHAPGTGGVSASITTRPAFGSITAEDMDEFMTTNAEIAIGSTSPTARASEPDGLPVPTPVEPEQADGEPDAPTEIVLASVDEASGAVSFGATGSGTQILARRKGQGLSASA